MSDKSDMQLHDYLEQVLGSRSSIKVLRTLVMYKHKVFTLRSLAEQAKISPQEASDTLRELAELNIVRLQPVGRAFSITLNERSYILERIIEPIVSREGETLKQLVQLLSKHLKRKVVSAVIFGSVARREEKRTSDIDLFVVASDKERATDAVAESMGEIETVFGSRLNPIVMTRTEFRSKVKSNLVRDIMQESIHVCGKKLGELV
jgi:predicted nucleotidyltransferase